MAAPPTMVSHAPTGRSKCKKCGGTIVDGSVRITQFVRSRHFDGFEQQHKHLECAGNNGGQLPEGTSELRWEAQLRVRSTIGTCPPDASLQTHTDAVWALKDRMVEGKMKKSTLIDVMCANGWQDPTSPEYVATGSSKAGLVPEQIRTQVSDMLLRGRTPACPNCKKHTLYAMGDNSLRCVGYFGTTAQCDFRATDQSKLIREKPAFPESAAKWFRKHGGFEPPAGVATAATLPEKPKPAKRGKKRGAEDAAGCNSAAAASAASSSAAATASRRKKKPKRGTVTLPVQSEAVAACVEGRPPLHERSPRLALPSKAQEAGFKIVTLHGGRVALNEQCVKVDAMRDLNSFYHLCVMVKGAGRYCFFTNWGRVGGSLEHEDAAQRFSYYGRRPAKTFKQIETHNLEEAVSMFEVKFHELTGNSYGESVQLGRSLPPVPGAYRRALLERGDGDDVADDDDDDERMAAAASGLCGGGALLTADGCAVSGLNVPALKAELKRLGQSSTGRKSDLVRRLEAALRLEHCQRQQKVVAAAAAGASGEGGAVIDARILKLVDTIFDEKLSRDALREQNVDMQKLPLGTLAKRTIREGYRLLSQIGAMLPATDDSEAEASAELVELNNQLFTMIPMTHAAGGGPRARLILSQRKFRAMAQLLEQLEQLRVAKQLRGGGRADPVTLYRALNAELRVLGPGEDEHTLVEGFVAAGQPPGQRYLVEELFSVRRGGEEERFNRTGGNRQLLFHGSRSCNFPGILGQGLKIAPPDAPVNGYNFGKGVYFANAVEKALQYAGKCSTDGTRLVAICEVALGAQRKVLRVDPHAHEKCAREGKDSTLCVGANTPSCATFASVRTAAGGEPVLVPRGRPERRSPDDPELKQHGRSTEAILQELLRARRAARSAAAVGGGGGGGGAFGLLRDAGAAAREERELRELAEGMARRSAQPALEFDELVVYDERRVVIRYLAKIKVESA